MVKSIKLVDYDKDLERETIIRCKENYPYEEYIDFMVMEYYENDKRNYALLVISGYKAGLIYAVLPQESLPIENEGFAVGKTWLIKNWYKWGYFECSLEEVYVIFREPPTSFISDIKSERGVIMDKIYKPIKIDIDIEDSDDGFFSLGFIFNYDYKTIPHNIGLCRDELEGEPDSIYIEADDQIYGFETKKVRYSINKNILTLTLLDENVFYWDKSKTMIIKIDQDEVGRVEECLTAIFAKGD